MARKHMKGKTLLSTVLTVILATGLIVVGVYAYYGRNQDKTQKTPDQGQVSGQDQLIGGDQDEHGCLIAAGYSWCQAKAKCLRAWEEDCVAANEAGIAPLIQQAFMDKYDKPASEVRVMIGQVEGDFARGSVKFGTAEEPGEGGIFLAYKEGGLWQLAFDGNGMYSCGEMEDYGFPDDLLPGCADETRE